MIRMYPDGVVEGTPEEVAAFKHIDAALTARNAAPKPRALRAVKAAPKKVSSSRPKGDQALRQSVRDWANANGKPLGSRGRIPQDVMDAYQRATREFHEGVG